MAQPGLHGEFQDSLDYMDSVSKKKERMKVDVSKCATFLWGVELQVVFKFPINMW